MNRTLAKALAVSSLVAVSALAVPVAANAGTIYPPSGSCTVTPATTAAGGTVQFGCVADTFSADETVTITVSGENGSGAAIGFVKFAVSTASGTVSSGADGSLGPVPIKLPSDASGTYNIAAVSPTSAGSTATVTVTAANGGLPGTGLDSTSLLGIWVGGGALLLAGGALAVAGTVRRNRRHADA